MKTNKKEREMLHPQHFLQQILSNRLLLFIIDDQKNL